MQLAFKAFSVHSLTFQARMRTLVTGRSAALREGLFAELKTPWRIAMCRDCRLPASVFGPMLQRICDGSPRSALTMTRGALCCGEPETSAIEAFFILRRPRLDGVLKRYSISSKTARRSRASLSNSVGAAPAILTYRFSQDT